MSRYLTEEEKKFIRDNHLVMSTKNIAKVIKRSINTVRRFKEIDGIVTPKKVIASFRNQSFTKENFSNFFKNRTIHYWTKEEEEYLIKNYANVSNKKLSEYLNISEGKIGSKAGGLNLKKSKEYMFKQKRDIALRNESFLNNRFKKGTEPPHKGKKMKDVLSPEALDRFNNRKGKFKVGHTPHNSKPIGSIFQRSINKETFIKIANTGIEDKDWVRYSRWLYESEIGPIPKGFVVRFKDDDNTNFELDNLYLFPKSSMPEENRYKSQLDKESLNQFREVLIVKGKVKILNDLINNE